METPSFKSGRPSALSQFSEEIRNDRLSQIYPRETCKRLGISKSSYYNVLRSLNIIITHKQTLKGGYVTNDHESEYSGASTYIRRIESDFPKEAEGTVR